MSVEVVSVLLKAIIAVLEGLDDGGMDELVSVVGVVATGAECVIVVEGEFMGEFCKVNFRELGVVEVS